MTLYNLKPLIGFIVVALALFFALGFFKTDASVTIAHPTLKGTGTTTVATSINPAGSLQTGLVGHWTFDGAKTTNTTALDSAGTNTGTLTNFTRATNAVAGRMGQAFSFDGVNDYVNLGSVYDFGYQDPVTISAWIYWKGSGTGAFAIASREDRANPFAGWELAVSNSKLRYSYVNNFASGFFFQSSSNPSVTANKWVHVVSVYTTNAVTFYIDGVAVADTDASADANGDANFTGISANVGGRDNDGDAADTDWNGSLDDVRIYNRALTPAEVLQLYNLGATTKIATSINPAGTLQDGLVGYWTFDGKDTTNTTALDLSGQGNTGTLTGFTRATNAVAGMIGQAFSFGGVDDYVATNASANLQGASQATIAFWGKRRIISDFLPVGARNPSTVAFIVNVYSDGVIYNNVSNGSGQWGQYNSNDTKWHHFVMVFNGNGTGNAGRLQAYLDGASQSLSFTGTIPSTLSSSLPAFRIGSDQAFASAFADGTIDDVRVYNRALTPAEITQLYLLGR